MQQKTVTMAATKNVALVAHDNKKQDLVAWCKKHQQDLAPHTLFGTGTTGAIIEQETGLPVRKLISGPLGGDQQIGALITEGKIDFLIFFWDPFEPLPHDPDVKALLRIAAVWNIPVACNHSSADVMVASTLFRGSFDRKVPDYESYLKARLASA
ncbi:methylglyoxal synthase [Simiduia aestuariiviva]|uniref:Methylglyoxal synthase n=1 Tax=Simiduia aestuariiviva TaxID=1510459 RepID=A0A839UQ92_9GAMM|nr:methylglyoxal synthase [Simiduia aestuariiviva]MBB3167996.1 methylglyoxal synthase [Simiduia aestuariiviva]